MTKKDTADSEEKESRRRTKLHYEILQHSTAIHIFIASSIQVQCRMLSKEDDYDDGGDHLHHESS